MENDEKHGTKLLETLEVYLSENGALRKTARRLFVHVSTLRGRLDRVEHLCDLDLRNAKARLNLQISMEVYRMAKGIGAVSQTYPVNLAIIDHLKGPRPATPSQVRPFSPTASGGCASRCLLTGQ